MDTLVHIQPMRRGFTTLEILISLTIMTLVLSGAILVSFSNTFILTDGNQSRDALRKAQELIEQMRADGREDFRKVVPVLETMSGIYRTSVSVTNIDFFTKKITAFVKWYSEYGTLQETHISTIVSNIENAVGGDTCDATLSGNWAYPTSIQFSFNTLIATTTGTYPITGIDVYQHKLYIATNNSSSNQNTLFVFDVSNPFSPVFIDSVDNDTAHNSGANAIATDGRYAYLANASGVSVGQLQVIDLAHIHNTPVSFKVPGVTGSSGIGNSIFYKNGYVYLGLKSTGSRGPEFHIIDVHTPSSPQSVGSYTINHDVNAVYMRNNYIYLAHPAGSPNNEQLLILDAHDPHNLVSTPNATYYTGSAGANGKSLFTVGTMTYLGATVNSSKEFYALDTTNPTTIVPTPTIQAEVGSSVTGLIVREYLAFLLTTKQGSQPGQLKIIHATSTAEFATPISLAGGVTASGNGFDCEGNYMYAGSTDTSGNGYLTIITAS